ncbi:MAG TPA: VWA domain-containing protein [Pyrinomonadaceae bacterium]|jgi:VWFA-related protein
MKTAALFIALFLTSTAASVFGQGKCLSSEDAKKIIESLKSSAAGAAENKKLRKELIEMSGEREKLDAKLAVDSEKNQDRIPELNQMGERHLMRVCQLLRENGWIGKESVREDGFSAFLFLIISNKNFAAQNELLPVLVEASKKGDVKNPFLAAMVDSIRVGSRMPQIFGTQAAIRNNVVYIYPILNEEKVDEWRKQYDLPPLATQIRAYEGRYLMPVVRSYRQPTKAKPRGKQNEQGDTEILGISDEENAPITIDTRLVNLNVRVQTQDLKNVVGEKFSKEDFTVAEDGVEQEISFFSSTEQPFDLVLLLDFSGSTIEKRGLIKKAALRFVELARPIDRVAIVAFATDIKVVSDLTGDKAALNQKIKDIELDGASPIWDSLRFVYDRILKEKTAGRRSAILFMTDAEDNSLHATFADALELARRGDTTIFPVYLGRQRSNDGWSDRFLRKSQQSLAMLAEESGGQFYKAGGAGDLKGIYEQIVGELGQVYSIGYEPKNEARDGGWRALSVKLKARPDLVTRTRRGYYAN